MKTKINPSLKVRKTDKKILTFILLNLFLLTSALTFAQKPNYAGDWNLNEGKSQLGEGGRGRMAANKLKITQDANAIVLERTSKRQTGEEFTSKETITLDGKECENTLMENRTRKSTANWSADGKSLTISSSSVFERDGNKMEMKSVEIFKLSDDGSTLSIDATSTSPRGDRKQTLAYDKAK
jgi:hypothetical protein